MLICNSVSHWLGVCLESALIYLQTFCSSRLCTDNTLHFDFDLLTLTCWLRPWLVDLDLLTLLLLQELLWCPCPVQLSPLHLLTQVCDPHTNSQLYGFTYSYFYFKIDFFYIIYPKEFRLCYLLYCVQISDRYQDGSCLLSQPLKSLMWILWPWSL